jgi:ubiquinone/menaquinone biosynthesis C-methylase UbiE
VIAVSHGVRYLTFGQAGRVYDRIGRLQDVQALVERPAIDDLVAHADFEQAGTVFELGYGTGALGWRLLDQRLPAGARYVGVDVSPHMQALATRRLARFADRTDLRLSDGSLRFPFADGSFDRVLACYVLDLLSPQDIDLFLAEAARLLAAGGLLCLSGLTPGSTRTSRVVTRLWHMLWALRPELVGGCRPLRISERLDPTLWTLRHHEVVTRLGFSFENLVAAPHPSPVVPPPQSS